MTQHGSELAIVFSIVCMYGLTLLETIVIVLFIDVDIIDVDNNFLISQVVLLLLSLPSSLFYLLPASLQMLSASLVATLASWLGETAENVTNECRERTGQVAGELVRRNKNNRRRRRS